MKKAYDEIAGFLVMVMLIAILVGICLWEEFFPSETEDEEWEMA